MTEKRKRPETRKCPECGKAVYYGIYCSNYCAKRADKRRR